MDKYYGLAITDLRYGNHSLVWTQDFETYYWYLGAPQHFTSGAIDFEVSRCYGLIDEDDDGRYDEIRLNFMLTFRRPRRGHKGEMGFLAPDGRFFPAKYGCHYTVIREIAVAESKDIYAPTIVLPGWLVIYRDYVEMGQKTGVLTRAQRDRLREFYADPSPNLDGPIRWSLEHF